MAIYLDNAATSFPKPPEVPRAVAQALEECGANPGRGGHRLSLDANRLLLETREGLAQFFGVRDPARIVFTGSATQAINQALFGLLVPGDRVVTSSMEHNAVTRPLRALQDRGVAVVKVPGDRFGWVDPGAVKEACRAARTRLVVLTHCSNVTGTLQAVDDIGTWCRREGILLLVDAAQSAGLVPIHVEEMAIDLLAVPGHKGLYGPPGTGMLYVREGLQLAPLVYGGTGTHSHSDLPPEEMPERLESGTQNSCGLAGLAAGLAFLRRETLQRIRRRERELIHQLISGLKNLPGVVLYGPLDPGVHGGALSFTLEGMDPAECGFLLDHQHGICSRVGLHCAPDAHRTIGTFPRGTVRVSPGYFNTPEEIEHLIGSVAALAARSSS